MGERGKTPEGATAETADNGDARWSVADTLRRARLTRHLNQAELAARLGMRQRQISDLERGVTDSRLSTVQDVARALDLEMVLIPRRLISAVDALQRAEPGAGNQPLYALDADDGKQAPDEPPQPEIGDRGDVSRAGSRRAPRRTGPRR